MSIPNLNIIKSIVEYSNFLVFGYGITGREAALFLKSKNKNVTIVDMSPVSASKAKDDGFKCILEENFDKSNIDKIDCAILSPGIRFSYNPNHVIIAIKESGMPIISDLDLLFCHIHHVLNKIQIVGVTGSCGKSTFSMFSGHLFSLSGKNSVVVGNIGISPFKHYEEIINLKYEIAVFEVSSQQLDISNIITFNYGCILSLSKNHILEHGSFEAYAMAKFKIISLSKCVYLNWEEVNIQKYFERYQVSDLGLSNKNVKIKKIVSDKKSNDLLNLINKNSGGLSTSSNCLKICSQMFIDIFKKKESYADKEIINSSENFNGLPHRMECFKTGDFNFINNSKCTNIESFNHSIQNINYGFVICCGLIKEEITDSDFDIENIKNKVVKIYTVRPTSNVLNYVFQNIGVDLEEFDKLEKACEKAMIDAMEYKKNFEKRCPSILLSPIGKSFDTYKNFEERGLHFKTIMKNVYSELLKENK